MSVDAVDRPLTDQANQRAAFKRPPDLLDPLELRECRVLDVFLTGLILILLP
ncbi:hypothetical protein [Nitrococcus mobilis]|uniref:hypothetical protein n=1 Tax=Nitrococcus mobilis TaxID=35797 RepID=UPI0003208C35|nr:hypothetical protein [Nitrococcus mobilis]